LGARFDYEEARVQAQPMKFACPSVVLREGETNSGATEIFHPWAAAVAPASYFPAQNWCFGKSGQGRAATQDPPGATGGGFYRA
jgi:hypothetical protein